MFSSFLEKTADYRISSSDGQSHTFSCHGQEFLKAGGPGSAWHYGVVVSASLGFGPDWQDVL